MLLPPATNTTLSQTMTVKTLISMDLWKILMEQLNEAKQENKLVKKTVKKTIKNDKGNFM